MFLFLQRRAVRVFLFFFLALFPLKAAAINISWAIHGSIFHFAANNGTGADPAPILPSLGASFALNFGGPLSLELTEDLYFTNYEYNSKLNYPMACNPENRSAFVFGFITGLQLAASIPITHSGIAVRLFGGPSVDLRIVTLAFGLHPSDTTGNIETNAQLQTNAISAYFWTKGRWFLPVLGAGMNFPVSEYFFLGFDFRAWFPVYRLWTDKDIPAVDGWRFGFGFRITPRGKSE